MNSINLSNFSTDQSDFICGAYVVDILQAEVTAAVEFVLFIYF